MPGLIRGGRKADSNPGNGMEHILRCVEICQIALVIREVRELILALNAVGLVGSRGRRSRRKG